VRVKTLSPYASYSYRDQRVENFLIEIEGTIKPANEITGTEWYSSVSKIKPSDGFRDMILPRLLREGLID